METNADADFYAKNICVTIQTYKIKMIGCKSFSLGEAAKAHLGLDRKNEQIKTRSSEADHFRLSAIRIPAVDGRNRSVRLINMINTQEMSMTTSPQPQWQ